MWLRSDRPIIQSPLCEITPFWQAACLLVGQLSAACQLIHWTFHWLFHILYTSCHFFFFFFLLERGCSSYLGTRFNRERTGSADADPQNTMWWPLSIECQKKKTSLQIFYEEGNSFETVARPQGCTHCVVVRNTEFNPTVTFVCFCQKTPLTFELVYWAERNVSPSADKSINGLQVSNSAHASPSIRRLGRHSRHGTKINTFLSGQQ